MSKKFLNFFLQTFHKIFFHFFVASHSQHRKKDSCLSTCLSPFPSIGDKYDLIDSSSPTESVVVTPIARRGRRHQPPLSSRLAELNEEYLLDNQNR